MARSAKIGEETSRRSDRLGHEQGLERRGRPLPGLTVGSDRSVRTLSLPQGYATVPSNKLPSTCKYLSGDTRATCLPGRARIA